MPKSIAVIGGGIAGLATTYRLQKLAAEKALNLDVTLFEADDRVGGVIRTTQADDFIMEDGPDCFLSEKPAGRDLAKDLGLEGELIGTNPAYRSTCLQRNGRLYPVPEGFYLLAPASMTPFLRSPLLSLAGKARVACELFLPARRNGQDESLASFVRRRFGRELLDRVAQPMVAGIYAADPERLSLGATFPRFLEMERTHGSVIRALQKRKKEAAQALSEARGPRYSLFLSFRNGMETLVRALAEKIGEANIRKSTRVERMAPRAGGGWTLTHQVGEPRDVDAVVVALPGPQARKLLAPLDPTLDKILSTVPYHSMAIAQFAFRADPTMRAKWGAGFVAPALENPVVFACSILSNKFEHRAPADVALIRAFVGGALNERLLECSEEEILDTAQASLERTLGVSGTPLFRRVTRWKERMPQYEVGHAQRMADMDRLLADCPGLYLIGNAYKGIGIPDLAGEAKLLAERIVSSR